MLRYAQAEKKNLDLQKRCKRAESELQQQSCEKELAVGQLCALKAENSHAAQCLEAQVCTYRFSTHLPMSLYFRVTCIVHKLTRTHTHTTKLF